MLRGLKMKQCTIDGIKDDLISYFKNKSIVPLLGSGFSVGAISRNGRVPSGEEFRKYMLEKLITNEDFSDAEIKQLKNYPFSKLCSIYELSDKISSNERREYYRDNFSEVILDFSRTQILNIDWPYIYTLNMDDSIERHGVFATQIISNFDYDERRLLEKKCVIKLHGDIENYLSYTNSNSRIFTSEEYAKSISKNKTLLAKLKSDCSSLNLLIIGCSLDDELDLLSLQDIPVEETSELINTRKILFKKGSVGKLEYYNYERFNTGIPHYKKLRTL